MVERITSTGQSSWSTLYGYSFELAATSLSKFRQVIDIKIDVVGDEQVEFTVVVIVDKRGAGGPTRIGDARLLCDVSKGAVAVIPKKMIRPETRYIDVIKA